MRAAPPRLITRWASQAGREPAALAPGNARLDTRGFAELLAEMAHLAGLVGFQETEAVVRGDWRRVLAADPAMVLALLATVDVERRSQGLQALIARTRASTSPREAEALLRRLLDGLLRLALELDEWLAPVEQGAGLEAQGTHRLIAAAIERELAPQLRGLLAEVLAAEQAGALSDMFRDDRRDRLRRHWGLALIEAEARALRRAIEHEWIDRLLDQVAEVAESFVREIREISVRAGAALEPSLGSGTHPPHVALVMAFARVFAHAQDRLNAVPQRIAAFYQEQVLRDAPRGAAPDQVLLAVVPRRGARPQIAQGMLIPAGKDAHGAPIGFAVDSVLEVTGATLETVRLWTPVPATGALPAHVEARVFAAGPDGAVGDPAGGIAAPAPAVRLTRAALIASPALALAGGTRRIMLRLACDPLDPQVTPGLLAASVAVSVSTAAGWLALPPHWQVADGAITFAALLAPDAPALAPCAEDGPALPALRLTLAEDAAGLALLGGLALRDAVLEVAVKDLPGLTVHVGGQPASAELVSPFTLSPLLRIAHPALAARPLDRLVVHFDWSAVPPGDEGFGGYYRGYVVDRDGRLVDRSPFDNAAFQVTLDAPVPGSDPARRLPLFAATMGEEAPPPAPDIFAPGPSFGEPAPVPPPFGRVAAHSWLAAARHGGAAEPLPDEIAVTLVAPEDGFGEQLYAINSEYAARRELAPPPAKPSLFERILNALAALRAKLRAMLGVAAVGEGDAPEETVPAPVNPFFVPMATIRVDYAARIAAPELSLFQALPFEGLVGVGVPAGGARLFAPLPDRLTIDVALAGARAGDTQSLLVRLGPARDDGVAVPAPIWRYHGPSGWQPLPARALLSDTSAGLSATGIVRIALPADAVPVPGGEALSLRAEFASGTPPPIVAITPDALSATRVLHHDAAGFAPLAAGTIAKLPGLPGVARLVQPVPSAGGRPPEDESMLRRRLAERVRHRARGTMGWDLERLVLSEFPGIAKVRALSAADPALASPAGGVTLVVVPAPGGADPPDPDRPRALPRLRSAIQARLAAVSSPFAGIVVADPVYVAVDIDAQLNVRGDGVDDIGAALAALLSPWAEPGLDLDDDAGIDAVRAAIAGFLLARPEVVSIDRLAVTLREPQPPAPWRVPVAGDIEVRGIAADRGVLAW